MFCLRSWLPLLFIPTNASPAFIFLFFVCTYFLNRPCVYCSFLLLILFLTSCNWSDRCFFDFGSNWFLPRPGGSYIWIDGPGDAGVSVNATCASCEHCESCVDATAVIADVVNTTAGAALNIVAEQIGRTKAEWTGLGMEWMRSLLGRREWRIECLDLYVRL